MKAHLFVASSSQGCAHYGLRRAADDGEEELGAVDPLTSKATASSSVSSFAIAL